MKQDHIVDTNKKVTAVESFDEQLQEYVIAQDVVARKLIIEISFEEHIKLKKQAKEMEKEQMLAFYSDRIYEHKELREEFEQYYNKIYNK